MKVNKSFPEIWLVEDSPADAAIIEETLEDCCEIRSFVRVANVLKELPEGNPGCILLDLSLPDSSGLEGLIAIQEANPYLPVVILTGRSDMELALKAINQGAEDYLIKNHLSHDVLMKTISFAVERSSLRRELLIKNDELAQNKRRVEDLTYALTHDIRSPLSSLRICMKLLNDVEVNNPEVEKFHGVMSKSVDQMHTTIEGFNEVLQMREKSHDVYEWINISDMWKDLKRYYTNHLYDIDVAFVEKFEYSQVYFIPFVLRSILQNLLSNSIKYRRQTMPLEISLELVKEPNGSVLTFTDNGMGMDMDQVKNRLFEPFSRFHTDLDVEGTGVGLYIIKAMMEANGGAILVNSKVDEGTSFRLSFNEADQQHMPKQGQA